jgi:hypothetical protein
VATEMQMLDSKGGATVTGGKLENEAQANLESIPLPANPSTVTSAEFDDDIPF